MLSQDTNNWVERMVAKLRRPKRTKTTEYKLSKRQHIQGMRTNNKMWQDLNCKSTKIGLIVLLTLATVTLVYRQHVINKQQKQVAAAKANESLALSKLDRIEAVWVSCLNNRAVYVNNDLHLCNLANTHIKKGEGI